MICQVFRLDCTLVLAMAFRAALWSAPAARFLGYCLLQRGLRHKGLESWDGGHALGRNHAPALELPVLVLLQKHRAQQAGGGCVVGEYTIDTGTAFDLLVQALQQVGAPDLAPVGRREVAECQHVLLGLQHEFGGPGEALGQRGGQVIPAALDLAGIFLVPGDNYVGGRLSNRRQTGPRFGGSGWPWGSRPVAM